MNANTVTVRLFEPADLPELVELERAVYGSGGYSAFVFRQLHTLFPTLVWVAEKDGALTGHVCGAIEQNGQTGWLLNFAVHACCRRMGVGQRLLECCIGALLDANVKRIRTMIHPDNVEGIRLCEKLGFRQMGIEENYYGDGTDRLLLECVRS